MREKAQTLGIDETNISDKEIVKKLKAVGEISENFTDKNLLIEFSKNKNKDIRYYAVLNLAKLSDNSLLSYYSSLINEESTSRIRREIASAIGRLRSKNAIKTMLNLLNDKDPNVVLQSIRGLLVFKGEKKINKTLINLKTHKNELVRKVIDVEFFDKKTYQKNHWKFPDYLRNCIVNDDVVKTLKKVEDESVHLTFTSPPYYNARDYSIYDSYQSYLKFLEKVFAEVFRITKEGRFFVLNTSPIIIPRVGRKYSSKRYPIPYDMHYKLVSMGWEFIDDIVWLKPEPSVKNRVAGFNLHRKPLAYKPNCITECLMVYRKKSNKLIDWIYKQYPEKTINESKIEDGYDTNNVWKIDPTFDKSHSAVFPIELCDRVIKYYSFKGDLVFDPFAGSGSVGVSAIKNDRHFFLTEIDKTYYQRIIDRLENESLPEPPQFGLNQ